MTAPKSAPTLSYVYDGRTCLGHILARGKAGFEAFDRDDRSLGLFPTAKAAADALQGGGA
jgi:hypothetical protein